jgi:hypothetical protein
MVALVHSPEADGGQLLLHRVEEVAAGDVHEWQPRKQFPLAEGLDLRQVLQAGLLLGCLDQGEAHPLSRGAPPVMSLAIAKLARAASRGAAERVTTHAWL